LGLVTLKYLKELTYQMYDHQSISIKILHKDEFKSRETAEISSLAMINILLYGLNRIAISCTTYGWITSVSDRRRKQPLARVPSMPSNNIS